jgi:hypothetical protein
MSFGSTLGAPQIGAGQPFGYVGQPQIGQTGFGIAQPNPQAMFGTVMPVQTGATQKPVTLEALYKAVLRNQAAGTYWKADKSGRQGGLTLSAAVQYVKKSDVLKALPQGNHFVYWPQYSVAGTVSDIYNLLLRAGNPKVMIGKLNEITGGRFGSAADGRQYDLTPDLINRESLDPLNPGHATFIEELYAQRILARADKRYTFSLDQWQTIAAIVGKHRGAINPGVPITGMMVADVKQLAQTMGLNSKQVERIQTFEVIMNAALQGANNRYFNVEKFDPVKGTGSRLVTFANRATSGKNLITPTVTIDGKAVIIPIAAPASALSNVGGFLQTVVGRSKYAAYIPTIWAAFQQSAAPMIAGFAQQQQYMQQMAPTPAVQPQQFVQQPQQFAPAPQQMYVPQQQQAFAAPVQLTLPQQQQTLVAPAPVFQQQQIGSPAGSAGSVGRSTPQLRLGAGSPQGVTGFAQPTGGVIPQFSTSLSQPQLTLGQTPQLQMGTLPELGGSEINLGSYGQPAQFGGQTNVPSFSLESL